MNHAVNAPDPTGPQPDDWRWSSQNWLAYVAIADGTSQRAAAKDLGVSAGTVTRWVKAWRKAWGDGLFRAQAQANTEQSQNNPPAPMHTDRVKADWIELRAGAAHACGVTAGKARRVLDKALDELLEDDERRRELTAKDLASLATAYEKMTKASDRLADIDPRTRKQDTGRSLDPSILAGLEGKMEIQQVTGSVVVLLAEYREKKAAS